MLDLACGSGELLCTWARDHRITGTGVDISTVFLAKARARALELEVAEQVAFIHGDASNHVAEDPADIVALRRGDLDPYWRRQPPDQPTVEGCRATSEADFRGLPVAGWTRIPATNWPGRCARNSPPLRYATPGTNANTSVGGVFALMDRR